MEDKDILMEFLRGGWIVALIGALGMLARTFMDGVKRTHTEQI